MARYRAGYRGGVDIAVRVEFDAVSDVSALRTAKRHCRKLNFDMCDITRVDLEYVYSFERRSRLKIGDY
ncbi:MAG: hypothetical protein KKF39_04715 [Nanoarchaeota archaeon]|nr:hypothetical protein [Nanoarchaeota archaeon]